jgi:hypothetical protein
VSYFPSLILSALPFVSDNQPLFLQFYVIAAQTEEFVPSQSRIQIEERHGIITQRMDRPSLRLRRDLVQNRLNLHKGT